MANTSKSAQEHLMQNADLYRMAGIDVTDPDNIPFFLKPTPTLTILGMPQGTIGKIRPHLFRVELPGSDDPRRETRTHRFPFVSTVLLGDKLRDGTGKRTDMVRAFAGSLAARPLFDMIRRDFEQQVLDAEVQGSVGLTVTRDDTQRLLNVGAMTIDNWVDDGILTPAAGVSGRILFKEQIIEKMTWHLPADLAE